MAQGAVLGDDHRLPVHPGYTFLQSSVQRMGDIGLGQGELGPVLLDGLHGSPFESFVLFQAQIARGTEMEQVPFIDPDSPAGKRVPLGIEMEYPLTGGIGKYFVHGIEEIVGRNLCHNGLVLGIVFYKIK
jgi:hypothetical protein